MRRALLFAADLVALPSYIALTSGLGLLLATGKAAAAGHHGFLSDRWAYILAVWLLDPNSDALFIIGIGLVGVLTYALACRRPGLAFGGGLALAVAVFVLSFEIWIRGLPEVPIADRMGLAWFPVTAGWPGLLFAAIAPVIYRRSLHMCSD